MPIRVNCRHCGKQFSAWDDLTGQTVQCPKCKNRMIVAVGAADPLRNEPVAKSGSGSRPAATDHTSLDEAVDDLPSLDELVSDFPAAEADLDAIPSFDHFSGGDSRLDETPVESPPVAASPTPPPISSGKRPPRATQPANPNSPAAQSSDAFDDSDDLPIVCPNCNEPVPGGDEFCDACGYHRILKRVLDFDGVRRPSKNTGFERVLDRHLSEGETAENVLLWAKILAGLGTLALLGFIGICLGVPTAIFCLVCVGGGLTWLILSSKKQNTSAVNRDTISAAVWTVLLTGQRAVGWRLFAWPFPKTQVLMMNDPGFTDDDLAELDLDTIQTLDLERTQISNGGLVHLAGAKQLRFLVLRDTQVTAEGVQRLQAKQQELMIWH